MILMIDMNADLKNDTDEESNSTPNSSQMSFNRGLTDL